MHVYLHTHTRACARMHAQVVCLNIPITPSMFIYTHAVVCSDIPMTPSMFIYTCAVVCSDVRMASYLIKYKERYAQQTKQTTCGVVGNREA